MKKAVLISGLLLALGLLLGCGIPKDQYNAVVTERDTQKERITTLESNLRETLGELSSTQAVLAATNAELTQAQDTLAKTEKDLDSAKTEGSNLQQQLTTELALESGLRKESDGLKARIPTLTYTTYEDTQNGFTIPYPEKWSTTQPEAKETVAVFVGEGNLPRLDIARVDLVSPATASAYFDGLNKAVLAEGHYTLVTSKATSVAGLPAVKAQYLVQLGGQSDLKLEQVFVVVVKGQTAWTVLFTGKAGDLMDWAHTLNEMIGSFNLP